ncbi:VAMP712 protein [Hibiscus syriacus]|uniref:VAMP712 protein n=1 Tax=Hibiscus syriacus TaxID=106335 RepID=A0A6A2XJZ2_HIBSY|nr:VAMP712 protein [Hibiscus syriacus]
MIPILRFRTIVIFHVNRTDGLTVVCMADDASGRRIPFAFLEDIHRRFVKTYGSAIRSALPYAMNEEFSRVMCQQMDRFSSDPNADRLNRLKGEISQVRSAMIENIEKILERGNRLELLVEKTTSMQGNSIRFKSQSRRYKKYYVVEQLQDHGDIDTTAFVDHRLCSVRIFLLTDSFFCRPR